MYRSCVSLHYWASDRAWRAECWDVLHESSNVSHSALDLAQGCPHGSLSGKLPCARLVVVPSFACHVYMGLCSGLRICKERAGSSQSPRRDIKRSAQQPATPAKPERLQAEGLWAYEFEEELCNMSCSHRQLPLQAWSSSLGCAACRV